MEKASNNRHIKIPVDFCRIALNDYYGSTGSFFRPFQLYIYLSGTYSGVLRIPPILRRNIADTIGVNERTIRNCINDLTNKRWITHNPSSGFYFILGIDRIRKNLQLTHVTAAEFFIKDISKLKGFLIGAIIAYIINGQKRVRAKTAEQNNVHLESSEKPSLPGFYYVSTPKLASELNVSLSTAHRYKCIARQSGYIDLKQTFIDTKLHVSQYHLYKEFGRNNVRIFNITLWEQGIDKVKSNVRLRSRKEIHDYLMRNIELDYSNRCTN